MLVSALRFSAVQGVESKAPTPPPKAAPETQNRRDSGIAKLGQSFFTAHGVAAPWRVRSALAPARQLAAM